LLGGRSEFGSTIAQEAQSAEQSAENNGIGGEEGGFRIF